MKKLFTLFVLLSSFTFANDFNVKQLDEYTQVVYEMEKKEPMGAFIGSFLVPSVGHAYAGNWGKGLKFLGAEILALAVMSYASSDNSTRSEYVSYNNYNNYNSYYENGYYRTVEKGTDNDWLIGAGAITFLALRVWENIDAYKTAKHYNSNLIKRIELSPILSGDTKSAGIQLNYKF